MGLGDALELLRRLGVVPIFVGVQLERELAVLLFMASASSSTLHVEDLGRLLLGEAHLGGRGAGRSIVWVGGRARAAQRAVTRRLRAVCASRCLGKRMGSLLVRIWMRCDHRRSLIPHGMAPSRAAMRFRSCKRL